MYTSVLLEFEDVNDEIEEIVEEEVVQLQNDLIDAGQAMWDTGNFKNSFAPLRKHSAFHWTILNDADYASILARGRRNVGGRMYGSEKWAGGIAPMIKKLEDNIERRTDVIV